jgi:alkylhydroperoxidase family enzyme
MAVVKPVPVDEVHEDARAVVDAVTKRAGRLPNFYGTMAHRPQVLKHLPAFYGAITGPGTVDPKLKELAYLKTSLVNGCEY